MPFFLRHVSCYPVAALLALIVLPAAALAQSTPDFPELSGRVVDNAEILSPTTESKITQMLQAHEQGTTEQVVVVTLPDLQGYAMKTTAISWAGIGVLVRKARTMAPCLSWPRKSARFGLKWAMA